MASATSEEDPINRLNSVYNNESTCFDTARFVDEEIPPSYLCAVGLDQVLNNPRITQCGHTFCYNCILKCKPNIHEIQDLQNPEPHLKCPKCRKIFPTSDLRECFAFKALLDELIIRCSFEQCQAPVRLENILLHEYKCKWNPEREVTCPDCKKNLRHSVLEDHYCKEAVLRKLEDLKKTNQAINDEHDKQTKLLEKMLQ